MKEVKITPSDIEKAIDDLLNENIELKRRIYTVGADLGHELYGHILQGDEETWNPEFYTDNKLDYRKLLIHLLKEVFEILEIDGSKWCDYEDMLENGGEK